MKLLPFKAALWGVVSGLIALFLTWFRTDAKNDQSQKAQLEDYEHAQDIENRVARNRADTERLRKYDDAGYRD